MNSLPKYRPLKTSQEIVNDCRESGSMTFGYIAQHAELDRGNIAKVGSGERTLGEAAYRRLLQFASEEGINVYSQ